MRYETKTLKDVITFEVKVNGFSKLYFPSDYDFYVDNNQLTRINNTQLTRIEWNEVMLNLGDEMIDDMMKVFMKHFNKTYKELKENEYTT